MVSHSISNVSQVVKYWPEKGKCGFLVWRYLLRRDDLEPAPWTPEGLERIQKLGLAVQVSEGLLSTCISFIGHYDCMRRIGQAFGYDCCFSGCLSFYVLISPIIFAIFEIAAPFPCWKNVNSLPNFIFIDKTRTV